MKTPNTEQFPTGSKLAVAHDRYNNKYYYDEVTTDWYFVNHCQVNPQGISEWELSRVTDTETGKTESCVSTLTTRDLFANQFSDRPFKEGETTKIWFYSLLLKHSTESNSWPDANTALKQYLQLRNTCSSYVALIRTGLAV